MCDLFNHACCPACYHELWPRKPWPQEPDEISRGHVFECCYCGRDTEEGFLVPDKPMLRKV